MTFHKAVGVMFSILFAVSLLPAAALTQDNAVAQPVAAIETGLLAALAERPVAFFVEMEAQAGSPTGPDLSQAYEIEDWDARGWYVYNALKGVAERTQVPVIEYATKQGLEYRSFFAGNSVYIERGTLEQAVTIARLPGVARLYASSEIHLEPQPPSDGVEGSPNAYGWNLSTLDPASNLYGMQAAQVWADYGIRGDGIVVANIDTGVDYLHPALVGQYRGNLGSGTFDHNYNWYQPTVSGCGDGTFPCDWQNQGSGTMGIMVGETADLTEQIGVAPGAQWIACMGCTGPGCTQFDLMACMEWMLAPTDLGGYNADPSRRPHIVNNSWGGAGCDRTFQLQLLAWLASGIFPAFSTGSTVACNAIGSPGDNPEVFNTAAHYTSGTNLYSGGPSCFFPNPSCDPDAHQVDPHVNSPTFGRTANNSGGYANLGGSAGAIPHAAGTVALVWSANPSYIGQIWDTFGILEQSANKNVPAGNCGEPACAVDHVPNYEYGWGYLDAYAAVTLSGIYGLLNGTVTDARTLMLLPGVTITAALPSGGQWVTVTDPAGSYTLSLGAGAYTVTAHADGYLDAVAIVDVIANMTTTQHFVLEPDAPGIDFDPDSFAHLLELGQTATETFAIHNLGPMTLTWQITESPLLADDSPVTTFVNSTYNSHMVSVYPIKLKTGAGDIAWLAAYPISGTVPPYSSFTSGQVYFDAGAVSGPGAYAADLYVFSDDPLHPELNIPVTLTVLAAGLHGIITGTGYCDGQSYPLDAQVIIHASGGATCTVTTDPATGYYHHWLNSGTYTVTATSANHLTATQVVQLHAGMTTTLDLALRLLDPCMSITPVFFSLALPVDLVYTGTISILNAGAGELAWAIQETPQDVPWVSAVPGNGVTLPGSLSDVHVVFDTHGLARNECYTPSLLLFHDDPGWATPFTIPLELCITDSSFYFYLPITFKN